MPQIVIQIESRFDFAHHCNQRKSLPDGSDDLHFCNATVVSLQCSIWHTAINNTNKLNYKVKIWKQNGQLHGQYLLQTNYW